jgi:hypothetical protein
MADTGALEALVARLEKVASLLEGRLDSQAEKREARAVTRSIPPTDLSALKGGNAQNMKGGAGPGVAPSVAAFNELVSTRLGRVITVAEKIGGSVLQTTEVLKRAFEAERQLVVVISKCKVCA